MTTPKSTASTITRKMFYAAMFLLVLAIFVGASRGVPPIFLAVAFIGEIILASAVYLGAVIERNGVARQVS